MERAELQGEALAFYFVRGVVCFAGRGSGFLGSRCAYGYGAICVDWHCWHPAVRVCVSEVSTLSLFVPLNQSCSVCVFSVSLWVLVMCILQWADLLDVPL